MSVTHNQTATRTTHPHSVHCDRLGCEWRTAHSTMEEAVRIEATHPCPHKILRRSYMTGVLDERGQEYTPPNRGKTLAEQAWDMLDSKIDELMDGGEHPDTPEGKLLVGWCQALCWTIHAWSPHWYATPDDVKFEASQRRAIRQGELDWRPTPGYQYNPMPVSHKEYARINKEVYTPKDAGTGTEAVKKVAAAKVKPEDIETIKTGLKTGFTVQELSRMLNYPEALIQSYA